MKVSKQTITEFKELNSKVKAGKATPEEFARAKELAKLIKDKTNRQERRNTKVSNDVNWYSKYPDLLKDAANVIFNEIAGTRFDAPFKATVNSVEYPTVGARFTILPTIGKCLLANDPFNYQMRDLWLKLHRAYRGVGTYEYADLGIVIFAIMQTFADIARAERIYGLASKFLAQNRSYPNVIMEALGLDPTAMAAEELADFRYRLNRCISKAGILCLPKGFSAFELYIRLFGSLFKDADNVRAQWYFYDSDFRIDYDPTFATGSSIVYTKRTKSLGSGTLQSLSDVIDDINTQLDNLLSDTDVARMCSDILKAFGENGIQTLLPIPENFTIDAVNDEGRKEQLHNTTLVGSVAGGDFSSAILTALGSFTSSEQTLRIYQEGGVVKQSLYSIGTNGEAISYAPSSYHAEGSVSNPTVAATLKFAFNEGRATLDTWRDSPSPDDIVEMTRQTIVHNFHQWTSGGSTYHAIEMDNYPIYVVTRMSTFTGNPSAYLMGTYGTNYSVSTTLLNAGAAEVMVSCLSKIDWAPRISLCIENSGVVTFEALFWDMDNYSLISAEALSRLHDACNLSVFKLDLAPSRE